jgi:hypothetical protein
LAWDKPADGQMQLWRLAGEFTRKQERMQRKSDGTYRPADTNKARRDAGTEAFFKNRW